MARALLCTRCLNEGAPKKTNPGSFAVEVLLWILLCVPGLIYSAWRIASAYDACAKCGAKELVPSDSPIATKLRG
jgi:hypothetical protein